MNTNQPAIEQNAEPLIAGLPQTQIEDLKLKHGEIHLLEHPVYADAVVIARRPSKMDYDRFVSEASDDRKNVKTKALETFVKRAIVHPERTQVDKLIERYPGLVAGYGDKLLEMVAVDQRVEAKKL
jgi:hypothetical protein